MSENRQPARILVAEDEANLRLVLQKELQRMGHDVTVLIGDITAKTETARLVVTGQMITDLIFLGAGLRIILGAVGRGRQRRQQREP